MQCHRTAQSTQCALLGFDLLANFVIQWTASSPTSAAWTQPTSLIQSLESRRSKAAFWNLSSTMTFPDLGSASWTCQATAPLSLASTRCARAEIKILWTLERGLLWSPLETLCGTRYPWYQPIMSMTSTIVRVRFRKYSIFFSFINLQEKKAKVRPTPWQTTAVWKMACKITVIWKTLAQPQPKPQPWTTKTICPTMETWQIMEICLITTMICLIMAPWWTTASDVKCSLTHQIDHSWKKAIKYHLALTIMWSSKPCKIVQIWRRRYQLGLFKNLTPSLLETTKAQPWFNLQSTFKGQNSYLSFIPLWQ